VIALVPPLAANVSEAVAPDTNADPLLVQAYVVLPFTLPVQLPTIVMAPPVIGRLALPWVNATEQPVGVAGGVVVKFKVMLADPAPLVGSLALTR
jgi:hypothetical protein